MIVMPSLNEWIAANGASLKAVVLDIDGVLLNSGRRLPGSCALIALLKDKSLPFVLLTNDGNHSIEEKSAFLQRAGLPIAPEAIISCGHAIAPLIQSMGLTDKPFFIMGDTGRPCYAEAAGLTPVRDLSHLARCAGVIIGEEHYDWEPVINAVVNFYISHPDAPLIVPNPDEFYPSRKLKINIAAGGIARFIRQVLAAYGQSLEPIFLGKPYQPIFRMAVNHLETLSGCKIASQNVLMVGDNIASDIAGGGRTGFQTALVLTGVTNRKAIATAATKPDMIFETL